MNWGVLIRETYDDIIRSVTSLILQYAYCKSKTTEDMWEELLFKKELWHHYYISHSVEGEPLILPRAAF